MTDVLNKSIFEHARAMDTGEYSSYELTKAFLDRIALRNEDVGAFLSVDPDGALDAAKASDERRKRGETLGLLDGIPFSLKDNICAKGLPLTCASKMLEHYVSPYDATVTERLKAVGAVLLGKNNMDEFAMGSSNTYSAFKTARNPVDLSHVTGGSSGGSAAAVADGQAVFSLGTDTGGSVRQPAAFCGVWGMKPTYGLLSRYGVAAMATSLDCVGVMTQNGEDCSAVLSALIGKDARDATSVEAPDRETVTEATLPVHRLRVAIVSAFSREILEADVRASLKRAIDGFSALGADIEEVELPLPKEALASYAVLSATEASSNLARYDGILYGRRSERAEGLSALYEQSRGAGFGREVKRRVLFGTDMLLDGNRERYYLPAQHVRGLMRQKMGELLSRYDLILTPTAPTVAFSFERFPSPEQLYYADLCTVYASLAGFPALSFPFGQSQSGLPCAVQLTARPFSEGLLLAVARRLREVTGYEA